MTWLNAQGEKPAWQNDIILKYVYLLSCKKVSEIETKLSMSLNC